jgi:FkbM family methyltransferase
VTETREISYLGHQFLYPSESLIGRFLEAGKGWDVVLGRILPYLLPPDPVIVEVGANIGASTVQMLAAKPGAHLYLFEPSERFRPYLLQNLKTWAAEAEVYPWAAGKEMGILTLRNSASSATTTEQERDWGAGELLGEQEVRVVTLDGLPVDRVDFLKVDVDGSEFDVLAGAENILRNMKPLLFFELATYLMAAPQEGLSWLCSLGYQRLFCLTPTGSFVGATETPEEAISWAEQAESRYVDILAGPPGMEGRIEAVLD